MNTQAIADLSRPAPRTSLQTGHCSNCARFVPSQVHQGHRLCWKCQSIEDRDSQIWACFRCETMRKWGEGMPENKELKKLNCIGCGQVTLHNFVRIQR